jgi:hypothetical protein
MTMSIWVFLLIIGLALLTGHGVRAKAAAAVFFVIGVFLGGTYFGHEVHNVVTEVASVFS